MTKQVLALPESARDVLRAYTGFTAIRVNFAIWHGSIPLQVQETIAVLDNALASGTMLQSVILYRIRHYLFSISAFPKSRLNKNCKPSFTHKVLFLSSLLRVLGICNFPAVIQFFKCTFLKGTRAASLFSLWHCQISSNRTK